MDILPNNTRLVGGTYSQLANPLGPRLSVIAVCTILFWFVYLLRRQDPYHLHQIPTISRSRVVDAYRSGVFWRVFVPRFIPYVKEGYDKYSKKGKPFKIWSMGYQTYIHVLPAKYLERVKNVGVSELSFPEVLEKIFLPEFSSGHFDSFEIQIASKLVNGNLAQIKPLVQVRAEQFIDREIGDTRGEWKRFNARTLSLEIMKYVSGRVIFGANLADNKPFTDAMERYTVNVIPSLALQRFFPNLGPLRRFAMYFVHMKQRSPLATAAQFVTADIAQRKRVQQERGPGHERPVDCIQWILDQDVPGEPKKPEDIANQLLHLSAAIIDAPALALLSELYSVASNEACLDELRVEISQCLAEAGGAWNEKSIASMKKFDSFIQECFRHSPGLTSCTVLRIVMSDTFRFDDALVLPKGTLLAFPTMHILQDPDVHPDPAKFDPLRFYKLRGEDAGSDRTAGFHSKQTSQKLLFQDSRLTEVKRTSAPNGSCKTSFHHVWMFLTARRFGFGRQACPGRFYSLRLLKTVIGELILRYDIRYAGGDRPRPAFYDLDPLIVEDTSVDVEFRLRVGDI
ncbi:cytochrome P450 [Aspergillus californicus]